MTPTTLTPEKKTASTWREDLGVSSPLHKLAVSMSWHTALAADCDPVVDPSGDYDAAMPQADYVAMVDAAKSLLQRERDAAGAKAASPNAVQILTHQGLDYAVVMLRPSRGQAMAMFSAQKAAKPGQETDDMLTSQLLDVIVWPADGTRERQDLLDRMPMAVGQALPQALYDSLGWLGARVKRRA